jgi:hypothetical protein
MTKDPNSKLVTNTKPKPTTNEIRATKRSASGKKSKSGKSSGRKK